MMMMNIGACLVLLFTNMLAYTHVRKMGRGSSSLCNGYFEPNTLGKGMNPIILPAMG